MGATGIFYSRRSFQDLLVDALQQKGINTIQEIKHILGTHTFASFLLQHPEHRIVSRITVPTLYLIHRGSVSPDGTVQIEEVSEDNLGAPKLSNWSAIFSEDRAGLDSWQSLGVGGNPS
jgi:hypothetical protein